MKEHNVDYRELRRAIVKSCVNRENGTDTDFGIDYEKLTELTTEIGVVPVALTVDDGVSHILTTSDVPTLSEYFKGDRLEWMNDNKSITTIVFVEKEVAEEVATYIEENKGDSINVLAHIIATQPCYFALVVGYLSTDPDRFNKLNYLIGCRANSVVLKRK